MTVVIALLPGVAYKILDALQTTADTTSDPIALPNARDRVLTWQSSFAVAPGAVSLSILASADNGVTYQEVDTSTQVGGDLRQLIPANWTHIKVRQVSRTGGTAYTTVSLLLSN